jgi:amidase
MPANYSGLAGYGLNPYDARRDPREGTNDGRPAPFGVSFTGMACSEPRLIELAYAFEQATKRRVPPKLD